ncbi:MAG: hypothetical protein HY973_00405 [Candidatus Kerfeldbacteria bacterium]|nr:hypothetical protein [Candidatus Kerfeldbacteria bacterium]
MSKQKELTGRKKSLPSTTRYLDIAEIRDNAVILKDGTLRGVLMCSSVNFSLKSDDEQNAIVQGYVSFLNSLEFPLQIVIQSRKLNIDGYLSNLDAIAKQQTNELLRVQISDYTAYVKELISLGDIMTKRFYVIVPYSPGTDKRRSFWERFVAIFSAAQSVRLSRDKFVKYLDSLDRRASQVEAGLNSMGLAAVRLDTQSLIELYYNSYNPELRETEKLAGMDKVQVETN